MRTVIIPGDSQNTLRALAANSHHIHAPCRTVGSTAAGAPGVPTSITPYTLISAAGANSFTTAPKLLFDGSEGDFGLPFTINSYDPSEVLITDVSANGRVWVMRFIFEQLRSQALPYADAAAAIAAGSFSDIAIKVDQTNADAVPLLCLFPRLKRGSKVWGAVKDSTGAGTISFLFTHFHGYPGAF